MIFRVFSISRGQSPAGSRFEGARSLSECPFGISGDDVRGEERARAGARVRVDSRLVACLT